MNKSHSPTNKQEMARELLAAKPKSEFGAALPETIAELCPFCGRGAEITPWHGGGPDKHLIGCIGSDEEGPYCEIRPTVTGETLEEALALWNTRALSDHSTVTGDRSAFMSNDEAALYGIVSKMHTAWMKRAELMSQQEGGFELIERMANLLDEIVDDVPALWKAAGKALSTPPPTPTRAIEAAAIERAAIEEVARIIRIRCRLVTGEEYEMAREAAKEAAAAIRALTPSPSGDQG